jgi:hypothetical protein
LGLNLVRFLNIFKASRTILKYLVLSKGIGLWVSSDYIWCSVLATELLLLFNLVLVNL